MESNWLVYGFIGALIGFSLGFLAGIRRNRQLIVLYRWAADRANENTASLMESLLNRSSEDE
jgi:hypothetical protein